MTSGLESLQRLAFDALPVLLDSAVKGMTLLIVAGAVVLAMRKASAAARQAVWVLALAALLVLPLASALLPSWGVLPGWANIQMSAEPVEPVSADVDNSSTAIAPTTDPFRGTDTVDTRVAPLTQREYAGDSGVHASCDR